IASATADHQCRAWRFVTEPELPERPFDAQQGARLHVLKQLLGEFAAGNAAYVQFYQCILWRAGDGETAPPILWQQDVQVLPGREMKRFAGWQSQEHRHDVGGERGQPFD